MCLFWCWESRCCIFLTEYCLSRHTGHAACGKHLRLGLGTRCSVLSCSYKPYSLSSSWFVLTYLDLVAEYLAFTWDFGLSSLILALLSVLLESPFPPYLMSFSLSDLWALGDLALFCASLVRRVPTWIAVSPSLVFDPIWNNTSCRHLCTGCRLSTVLLL